jgi:uncharacterized OB-fold protein
VTQPGPIPVPTSWSKPFWDALEDGPFTLQRCADCGAYQGYPHVFCTSCYSDNLKWEVSGGRGIVYTHTTIMANPPSTFVDEVPYTLVIVTLEEGVRLLARFVVDGSDESVECGQPVELVITRRNGVAMPGFKRTGD